jgi:hypothetical protein
MLPSVSAEKSASAAAMRVFELGMKSPRDRRRYLKGLGAASCQQTLKSLSGGFKSQFTQFVASH